jgi:hypothetical protein
MEEEFSEELDCFKLARGGLRFNLLTPAQMKTWIEQFIEIGRYVKNKKELVFRPETMSKTVAESLLASPQFVKRIPRVSRILDIPIPIRTRTDDIVYPKRGFNRDLGIYLAPCAPALNEMTLEQAVETLEKAHEGFCWEETKAPGQDAPQSKVHAFARILTPFARGLMGFSERFPLWLHEGNRPRCGKDYLAGVSQIVYLGHAFEDAALSKNPEETQKRIVAALRSGRRFIHFANCQYYLEDPYLIQAITAPTFNSRALGSNDANADLQLVNEIEYSISANALTYR